MSVLPLCSFTLGRSAVNATNSHLVHLARYGASSSGRSGPGSSHWRAASVTMLQRRQPSSRARRPRGIGLKRSPATLPDHRAPDRRAPGAGSQDHGDHHRHRRQRQVPRRARRAPTSPTRSTASPATTRWSASTATTCSRAAPAPTSCAAATASTTPATRARPAGVYVFLHDFDATGGDAAGDHLYSIEGVIGSAFADGLYGDDQRNVLRGEGGDDVLGGLGGDDTLDGGGGNDLLDGGAGNDGCAAAPGSTPPASTTSPPAAWWPTSPPAPPRAATPIGSDRLFGIENLQGTIYDDRLAGNAGANRLDGSAAPTCWSGGAAPTGSSTTRRYDSTPDGAGPHPRLQPRAGRPDRPARHRRQRAGERQPGVPVHRPGPVHGRRPAPLLPAGRRHGRRGQHDRRDRRRGDADRDRPAGLAPGHRLRPVAGSITQAPAPRCRGVRQGSAGVSIDQRIDVDRTALAQPPGAAGCNAGLGRTS